MGPCGGVQQSCEGEKPCKVVGKYTPPGQGGEETMRGQDQERAEDWDCSFLPHPCRHMPANLDPQPSKVVRGSEQSHRRQGRELCHSEPQQGCLRPARAPPFPHCWPQGWGGLTGWYPQSWTSRTCAQRRPRVRSWTGCGPAPVFSSSCFFSA